jgi:hypothetical protein
MNTITDQPLPGCEADDPAWPVLWAAQISSRYHARREAFFERWSRVTAATGVIFGSTAVASAFGDLKSLAPFIAFGGALVAAASAVDLVVGTATMARRHDDLRKRFLQLEAKIRATREPSENDIVAWESERLIIEMDEPPRYVGLCLLCENELGRANKDIGERTTVRWWVRWTAQWLQWPDEKARPLTA